MVRASQSEDLAAGPQSGSHGHFDAINPRTVATNTLLVFQGMFSNHRVVLGPALAFYHILRQIPTDPLRSLGCIPDSADGLLGLRYYFRGSVSSSVEVSKPRVARELGV